MIKSPVHSEIDRLLTGLEGELTTHSQVVDALLDVRSTTEDKVLKSLVDDSLRNIPGKNVTETEWLRDRLQYLDLMAQVPPVPIEDAASV